MMVATTDRASIAEETGVTRMPEFVDTTARDHVHAVVRRAGSSFFWAMRILPRQRREAVYAIYAFCREVDDIADDAGLEAEKRERLAAWRTEIERLYDGRPETPTGLALAAAIQQFQLPKEEFLRLIDAVELDAGCAIHAPTLAELQHYCRGVAGAVGMLLIRIFGAEGASAEAFAIALGEALQLTNILRDVAEDGARGRIYLPQEALAKAGIQSDIAVNQILDDPKLAVACRSLARTAQLRFAEADALLQFCDRRALRSALVMKDVYAELLARLIERDWRELEPKVRVGPLVKLGAALRHALF